MANLAAVACIDLPVRADHLAKRSKLLCTMLSQELHCADIDYRSLALHAGLLHSTTLAAKQRAANLAVLLCAETERHDACD